MFLGIEIGGTKLQLGVGNGDGREFAAFARHDIDINRGAPGILEQIEKSATALAQKHKIERIGIGFGGPVDSEQGLVTKSHQVEGWDHFPLARWCEETLGIKTVLGNDCDVACLAEAHFGAGRRHCLLYHRRDRSRRRPGHRRQTAWGGAARGRGNRPSSAWPA